MVCESIIILIQNTIFMLLILSVFLCLSLRDSFTNFLKFMGHLSYQCDKLLGDRALIAFLQRERYDLAILDAFNPCSFILAHKLGTSATPL